MTDAAPLLVVDDLHVSFRSAAGRVAALNGVGFAVQRGEVLAILGESGSGKSVTVATAMGLIERPPGSIDRGTVRFDGIDLLALPPDEHRRMCGSRLSLIFQDAIAALNPVFPVGWQIAEAFRIHGRADRATANREAVRLMAAVGIPDPEARARQYPHQFSGGMCQRVMIAMALALRPDLVIADEPTTALDVTVQAQILDLLRDLRASTGCALVVITHDLGVVAELADRVVVMYGGRVVEEGDVHTVFARPAHPYTRGLLASRPRLDREAGALAAIPGTPPNPAALPPGCVFHPRCDRAEAICRTTVPAPRVFGPRRHAACHFAEDGE
jgi:oligopeptide transport system ATP-binding protein